jgi:hypothetical protein
MIATLIETVLTYLVGIAIKKWPALEKVPNDIIPQITWVLSILMKAFEPYLTGTPAHAADSAADVVPIPPAIMLAGTAQWALLQLFDLVGRKLIFGGLFKKK